MPDRILRAGILGSEAVNQLSAPAELFYRRLMSVVDDYGRYDGRTAILRASLYPLQLANVSEPDVVTWLRATEALGLVRGYVVAGKPYLELVNFHQRLRAKRSKWPAPPSPDRARQDAPQSAVSRSSVRSPPSSDSHLLSNATETKSETEAESKKRKDGAPSAPSLASLAKPHVNQTTSTSCVSQETRASPSTPEPTCAQPVGKLCTSPDDKANKVVLTTFMAHIQQALKTKTGTVRDKQAHDIYGKAVAWLKDHPGRLEELTTAFDRTPANMAPQWYVDWMQGKVNTEQHQELKKLTKTIGWSV